MEWQDEAIVLTTRRHGETDAIATVLTRDPGRHAGLVKGGAGRRAGPVLQPGNRVAARWRARLSEQLGTLQVEPVHSHAARLIDDPDRLAALAAACAVTEATLPEREAHPQAFDGLVELLAALEAGRGWAVRYVRWERDLLAEIGFGLDLDHCAATGATEDLAWVSPRTGRAVSRVAGQAYADRLFGLPAFLRMDVDAVDGDLLAGLRITGHFLDVNVFSPLERMAARDVRGRFVDRIARRATMGGR